MRNRSIMSMTLPVSAAEAPDDTEKVKRLIHDALLPLILIERLTEFPVLLTYDAHALVDTVGEGRMLLLRFTDAGREPPIHLRIPDTHYAPLRGLILPSPPYPGTARR